MPRKSGFITCLGFSKATRTRMMRKTKKMIVPTPCLYLFHQIMKKNMNLRKSFRKTLRRILIMILIRSLMRSDFDVYLSVKELGEVEFC